MSGCAGVEKRLRALIDGELDVVESERVRDHLRKCARCREACERLEAVVEAVRSQAPLPPPPHLIPNLQLRLAAQRRAPARLQAMLFPGLFRRAGAWRWAGGVTTLALVMTLALLSVGQRPGAAEIARRAARSWSHVWNYGCLFVSTGVYQGQERTFQQRQFYRRTGGQAEFRLDTSQDYPLTTFIQPDRVIHYLPRGDWKGRGPLVIIRPRRTGEDALPFPFGVTWQSGGNVSLEQLIRQLARHQDAEVVGVERVGGQECYRVRFPAVAPGADRYELWVDRENFLPRRVSWFRDPDNHIVTEALQLQVNYDVLPAGTFDFQIPEGAFVIQGDVDPHVLALPVAGRTDLFETRPVEAARVEAWKRAAAVPFRVTAPEWLPEGFHLVRVRRRAGRWVDFHWLRELPSNEARVLKIVQQAATDGSPDDEGAEGIGISLRAPGGPVTARLIASDSPYPHRYLTWRHNGVRFRVFASGLSTEELLRVVASMTEVTPPSVRVDVTASLRRHVVERSEPSLLPPDPPVPAGEEAAPPSDGVVVPAGEPAPMMPETADEDPMPVGR